MKIEKLTLPAFAFLDAQCHEGNLLEGRDVVIHVRSASVLEFFDQENAIFEDNTIFVEFDYKNRYNIIEHKTCALHYCASVMNCIENHVEIENIINLIIMPAITWYKAYMDWEDENIIQGIITKSIASNN